ncbi:MAG: hypothetical protein EB078_10595, partial [Proteobacteria bacterium]|nr:hypothetical protein [Pseudomonadota bacterium]NDD05345.1 hypothetical protein [Pseudomonadota bacterium]
VVDTLRKSRVREAIEHRRVYRPWGYYMSVDHGGRYQQLFSYRSY